MNLNINKNDVEGSFDRIAKELLLGYAITINGKEFHLTEIEFYFYHPNHQDNYTHKHRLQEGMWRMHNQGLDITLQGNKEQDGGILIRGIKNEKYINGPRRIVWTLFEHFGQIEKPNIIQLTKTPRLNKRIIKTFRHLPNKKIHPGFHKKHYRYLVDLDELQMSDSEKVKIRIESEEL